MENFVNQKMQKYKEKLSKIGAEFLSPELKLEFEIFRIELKEKLLNFKYN